MQATEAQYNGHRPQARNAHGTADIKSAWTPPLPYNIDVEKALLGAILFENKAFDRVANFISPNHFYDPLHGRIFEILAMLIRACKTATPVTVKTFFENVEPIDANMTVPQYLGHLLANATTIIGVENYARTIVHLSARRNLIDEGRHFINSAGDTSTETCPARLLAEHAANLEQIKITSQVNTPASLLEFAEDAGIDEATEDVIERVIAAGSVGLLYGPSGLGKTFVAIGMVGAIAKGASFFGRRTKRAAGLYVALEGRGHFGRRLRAAVQSANLPKRTVARLLRGITLGRSGTAELGVATIIEAVRALEKASGRQVGLIVIDTLAKALAGDNENEAAAISAVLSQAGLIAEKTGAAVLIVHHPGKDTERGMRGSYSLFADADFVLKIDGEKGPDPKTLSIEKSKDDEEGPLGSFILEKFGIGSDRQGNEISSIVVREIAGLATSRRKTKRPAQETGNGKALTELEHLVIDGKGQKLTHHDRIPIKEEIWRAACHRKGLTPSTKQKSRNKAFERAHQALSRAGLIGSFDGYVWLIGDLVRKDDLV